MLRKIEAGWYEVDEIAKADETVVCEVVCISCINAETIKFCRRCNAWRRHGETWGVFKSSI